MLKIRLSRTGKKGQPSFRLMVQEHKDAVKSGKFVEIIGHYSPASANKEFIFQKERVEYWISKGAQPSDTVASLLKRNGMSGMEKYIGPRGKKAKKKKATQEPATKAAPAPAPAPAVEKAAEAPVEEKAPEPAAAEAPAVEEKAPEEPVVEEKAQGAA